MFSAALFARDALATVVTDVADVALQLKLHIIVFVAVRREAGELVRIHFGLTFWSDLSALARQKYPCRPMFVLD